MIALMQHRSSESVLLAGLRYKMVPLQFALELTWRCAPSTLGSIQACTDRHGSFVPAPQRALHMTVRPPRSNRPLPTGTVTFLFTDIQGSTALWEQHPSAMLEVLARHDAILCEIVGAHGGQTFKSVGDGQC